MRSGQNGTPRRLPLLQAGLLLALAGPLAAQPLSLDEAIAAAQRDGDAVQAAAQGVEAAAHGVAASKASYLPTLSLLLPYGKYEGDVFYDRFVGAGDPSGTGTDVGDFGDTTSALLRLNQTVYTGGALRSAVRAAELGERQARLELRRRQLEVAYGVTEAYHQVLLAEKTIEVAREGVRRSEELVASTRARRAEEEALEMEVLGAESQLAADRHALASAEDDVELARRQLNRLMGRPTDAGQDLTGSLVEPLAVPEATAGQTPPAGNPRFAEARLETEKAANQLTKARSRARPKVQLELFAARLENETLFEGTYAGASLGVAVPFLQDLVAGRGATRQARAQSSAAQRALAETRGAVDQSLAAARAEVTKARGAVEVADRQLAYHREKHRVRERSHAEALATFDDLLEAHAELSAAELDLYRAHFAARVAEARLARLAGTSLAPAPDDPAERR